MKVTQDNIGSLRAQKVSIATQVQDHLNKLTVDVNNIKATVEVETCGIDPNMPLVTSMLVPPIKLLIHKQELEVNEETSAGASDNNIEIDFYRLLLEDIYSIKKAAAIELRLRKNVIAYQEAK